MWNKNIKIIGGADGPTAVFIADKKSHTKLAVIILLSITAIGLIIYGITHRSGTE